MKKKIFVIFAVITILLLPKAGFASCAVTPSIEDEAKGASVIFVGTATKITSAQIAGADYSIVAKKPKWERRDEKVDVVTFSVSEAFKGVFSETIDIATGADGHAGYKFEGGTWLKKGQTYLVYAYKRESPDTIPDDLTEESYGRGIAKELRAIHKSFPKKLAAEINDFNSKVSLYDASICGRTTYISNAAEVEQVRKMFPEAKRFSTQADAQQTNGREAETATFYGCSRFPQVAHSQFLPALLQLLNNN